MPRSRRSLRELLRRRPQEHGGRRSSQVEHSKIDASTPPDVTDPRAKSQVHGKVTADKWNQ
jgi:hypothetical protein